MMVKDRSQAGGAGNGCRDSVGAGGKRVPAVVVESVALCDAARALSAGRNFFPISEGEGAAQKGIGAGK